MKRLMMLFVLIACVMVILLMFVKQDSDFHVLYKKSSYSMMKSSKGESFQISMLASKKESFYLDKEYITRVTLRNQQTSEQVSLRLNEVSVSSEVLGLREDYYEVSFDLSLLVDIDTYELTYQEATLELVYENDEILSIALGEFYYIEAPASSHINLFEMIATHEVYHGLTVSGLYLELGHNLPGEVRIKDIKIGSNVASVNPFYTKELTQSITFDDKLDTILYPATYDHLKIQEGELDFAIRKTASRAFYFPLTYHTEELLLHRFYIKILYLYDGELREEVIDDFPFIRQNNLEVREEEFDVYYPRVRSEIIRQDVQKS